MHVLFAPAVFGSENMRVALADNQRSVVLKSASGLIVQEQAGHGLKRMQFKADAIGSRPVRIRSRDDVVEVNGKSYRGMVELRKKRNGLLLVINDLPLEVYLKGVVAAEIPFGWESEALKAQAVAARTYALYQKKAAGARPYHILATVSSQVYAGRQGEHASVDRAVQETEGMVIVYDGEVIPAFYHSSCGGHTENASEMWGIDAPYLKGVDCECQEISKYGAWEKRMSASLVTASLARLGYRLHDITDIGIESLTPAGRVKKLFIQHAKGVLSIPAETLRAAAGYPVIPSVFFEIALEGKEIVISGRGMGHGVGLCQWGAKEMAQRGYNYRSILSRYYPGTSLTLIERL